MKRLVFWFDVVSPYAWLAFERLPDALEGASVEVEYRPLLFAGLLKHWGQKGPAEIEPKRAWMHRELQWRAARDGVPLAFPVPHPFNPLPLLRLAVACGPNRRVVEAVFRHVWDPADRAAGSGPGGAAAGGDPNDPQRLAALTRRLAPTADPASAGVKEALRAATDEAIRRGVFGVPSIEVDGELFWGADALPMLAERLAGVPRRPSRSVAPGRGRGAE